MFWLEKPAIVRESEIELMKQYLDGVYQSVSLTKFTRGQLYKISDEIFSFNKEEFPLRGKFKIFNEELVRENLYNSSTKTDFSQSLDELLKIID